jgi:type I restriction enzyme R subunit
MSLSEQATRKELIDQALKNAGWSPILRYAGTAPFGTAVLEEYPTANGPADYALFHNGELIAIVEAKKVAVGAQNVLEQAQRYARGLTDSPFDFNGYRVPFIYSTNGERIYFQGVREPQSRSRQIKKFHTLHALREMLARDESGARTWLATHPISHPLLRPYQRDAIENVEDALAQG